MLDLSPQSGGQNGHLIGLLSPSDLRVHDLITLACYDAPMDENAVLRELPCLECQELRAMRVRARIGAVVLAARKGETLPTPLDRDLLRGCCKRADEATSSVICTMNL
jgi:hypothetical protein